MANAAEYMLDDLRSDYAAEPVPKRIARLYEDDPEWGHLFGVLHSQLNSHFESINGRISTNRHYWADPSRELIKLFRRVEKDLHTLAQAGVGVEFKESYEDVIERVRPWLSPSGGSPLPEDFREPIEVERYVPVFTRSSTKVKLTKQAEPDLKMVGSGSYANVFSYIDPDYGIKFALKRAKKGISERDLERFRAEFDTMKGLSHPNLVEVYRLIPIQGVVAV
ncbi:protein kinase-like protein [Nocardioides sp. J9]|uniref:protein kinase n=1 Tax=Nocardioides sp. J9 TaxID=935844 RepID=UPI0011AD1DF1|nr:protein kinase [Nocardioides sp. J9]TWH02863.1 protein kinase-like protein [Nocardioides sp. J9]